MPLAKPAVTLNGDTITWDKVSGATGYIVVDNDPAGVQTLMRVATSARSYPVTPGHSYNVFARGPFSDVVDIPAPDPQPTPDPVPVPRIDVPGPPASVQATSPAAGQVTVTWTRPGDDGGAPITGYTVGRDGTDSHGGGPWSTDVPATTSSFTFLSLVPTAAYTFTVQAVNAQGKGQPRSATLTPAPVPVPAPAPVPDPTPAPTTRKRAWFVETSPWYRDIPDWLQAALVNDARATALHGSAYFNCSNGYGIPVWVGKASDPLVTPSAGDLNRHDAMHCPTGAHAASGTDGSFVLVDPVNVRILDAWEWNAGKAASAYMGILGEDTGMQGGCRAANVHYAGGVIFGDDLTAGRIDTALAIALPGSLLKLGPILPATQQDSDASTSYKGSVNMGTFAAIPKSVDLGSLGLQTPEGRVLADALQRKGAFVVDRAGQRVLFGDPTTVSKQQETNIIKDATALFKALWVGPSTGVTR